MRAHEVERDARRAGQLGGLPHGLRGRIRAVRAGDDRRRAHRRGRRYSIRGARMPNRVPASRACRHGIGRPAATLRSQLAGGAVRAPAAASTVATAHGRQAIGLRRPPHARPTRTDGRTTRCSARGHVRPRRARAAHVHARRARRLDRRRRRARLASQQRQQQLGEPRRGRRRGHRGDLEADDRRPRRRGARAARAARSSESPPGRRERCTPSRTGRARRGRGGGRPARRAPRPRRRRGHRRQPGALELLALRGVEVARVRRAPRGRDRRRRRSRASQRPHAAARHMPPRYPEAVVVGRVEVAVRVEPDDARVRRRRRTSAGRVATAIVQSDANSAGTSPASSAAPIACRRGRQHRRGVAQVVAPLRLARRARLADHRARDAEPLRERRAERLRAAHAVARCDPTCGPAGPRRARSPPGPHGIALLEERACTPSWMSSVENASVSCDCRNASASANAMSCWRNIASLPSRISTGELRREPRRPLGHRGVELRRPGRPC